MPAAKRESRQTISEIAYLIWEDEGRPDGRADEHWSRALARVAKRRRPPVADIEDEEKILAGNPDANIPALLTRDVPGG